MKQQNTLKFATLQTGIDLLSSGEYMTASRVFYKVIKKPTVPFDMIRAEIGLLIARDRFFRTPQHAADKAEMNARCYLCRRR